MSYVMLAILAATFGGLAVGGMTALYYHLRERYRTLEANLSEALDRAEAAEAGRAAAEAQSAQLREELGRRQHTMSTIANYEDGIAVAIRIKQEHELMGLQIEQIQSILQTGRKSPYAYDPETTSGDSRKAAKHNQRRPQL